MLLESRIQESFMTEEKMERSGEREREREREERRAGAEFQHDSSSHYDVSEVILLFLHPGLRQQYLYPTRQSRPVGTDCIYPPRRIPSRQGSKELLGRGWRAGGQSIHTVPGSDG